MGTTAAAAMIAPSGTRSRPLGMEFRPARRRLALRCEPRVGDAETH